MTQTGIVTDLQASKAVNFPSSTSPQRTYQPLKGGSVFGYFNNLNKVIIPGLFLIALSHLPQANAGPFSTTACLAACAASTVAFPVCALVFCGITIIIPA